MLPEYGTPSRNLHCSWNTAAFCRSRTWIECYLQILSFSSIIKDLAVCDRRQKSCGIWPMIKELKKEIMNFLIELFQHVLCSSVQLFVIIFFFLVACGIPPDLKDEIILMIG